MIELWLLLFDAIFAGLIEMDSIPTSALSPLLVQLDMDSIPGSRRTHARETR